MLPLVKLNAEDWVKEERTFFLEASSSVFRVFDSKSEFYAESPWTKRRERMIRVRTDYDLDGDVIAWVYKPHNYDLKFSVVIFND